MSSGERWLILGKLEGRPPEGIGEVLRIVP
jgi:hypothetical protein